jgi:hypothetical protein
MATDADFGGRGEPASQKREPAQKIAAQKIDPIDELMRIAGAAETDSAHRANVRKFAESSLTTPGPQIGDHRCFPVGRVVAPVCFGARCGAPLLAGDSLIQKPVACR